MVRALCHEWNAEVNEMDSKSLKSLKVELESEHARLTEEVAGMDAGDRELLSEASGENAYRDHMADQGSATFERELDISLEESVRERLEEVEAALKRIEQGTYGTCERCGATIPVERLTAVPTASLCITCKEAEEHR